MKKTMVSMLILAVLSFWIPSASAEVSQDLDPMVSPEPQATVTSENSMNNTNTSQTGNAVSTAETTTADKKVEETKKGKSKKSAKKKSSKKKSSFKSSKKQKENSY